jgi:hypothetical protein
VYNSIKRARASHFIQRPELEDRLHRSALLEFLLHGIRYAFPAGKGTLARGVPTGYAAPPLLESIAASSEPPPVWPYADGPVRGYSFASLHKNVLQAALEARHTMARTFLSGETKRLLAVGEIHRRR